jgi:hypothetical protein
MSTSPSPQTPAAESLGSLVAAFVSTDCSLLTIAFQPDDHIFLQYTIVFECLIAGCEQVHVMMCGGSDQFQKHRR